MINHFKNTKELLFQKGYLHEKKIFSRIVEIGSNDGIFTKFLNNKFVKYLGFEPSKNIFDAAKSKEINCGLFVHDLRLMSPAL
jgi:hypothetical protein